MSDFAAAPYVPELAVFAADEFRYLQDRSRMSVIYRMDKLGVRREPADMLTPPSKLVQIGIWMIPWAEGLLASAIVASHPEGTDEATMRVAVEAAGGRLTGESLVAAQLRAGNADAALKECERILSQLEAEGQVRAHWIMEELRIRALFALDRFADASDAAFAALTIVAPLGWQWLAWQLRASFVAALDALSDERLATERRSAVEVLMAVAGSLSDPSARARFLVQPIAAYLLKMMPDMR